MEIHCKPSLIISQADYFSLRGILQELNKSCTRIDFGWYEINISYKYPNTSFDSLRSLQSQLFTRAMKFESRKSNEEQKMRAILAYAEQCSFFEACSALGFSSYKFAKNYLERESGNNNSVVQQFLKSPSLFKKDSKTRGDLLQCISDDAFNSFENEILKQMAGNEFEKLLINLLRAKHCCFETEESLRAKGKPKTPDIVFLIPMIVTIGAEEYVVNWIDSKAMFADEDTFKESLDQFNGYCNRYGKGLVIYWLGFVESLLQTSLKDVCIADGFPEKWRFPTGEVADGSLPSFRAQSDA